MSKEVVNKNDIKEEWIQAESSLRNIEYLIERPLKYSIWLTNISLGLLGFYSALLLNIRGKYPINNNFWVIFTFIIISVPVIIGFVVRIRYEILSYYKVTKKFIDNIDIFLQAASRKLELKEDDAIMSRESISWNLFEDMLKKTPIKMIFLQFLFFMIALIFTIRFLFGYIFN